MTMYAAIVLVGCLSRVSDHSLSHPRKLLEASKCLRHTGSTALFDSSHSLSNPNTAISIQRVENTRFPGDQYGGNSGMRSAAVYGEQYVHAKQATDELTITHRLDAVLLIYARGQQE